MTAQIPDTFLFKGESYDLIGITSGDLVTPEQFGMEPKMMHTACYRGFYATYELTMEALYLRSLTLSERNGTYVPIDGIEAERDDYEATYRGLSRLVPFTGTIRLAKDFIEEYYVHMGFQRPTAFKTVLDFTLTNGKVVDVSDRSEEVERKRGEFKKLYETGTPLDEIEKAFSLDMSLD